MMLKKFPLFLTFIVAVVFLFSLYQSDKVSDLDFPERKIHLYGEMHGWESHLQFQLDRWSYFYTYHGMRHILIELPFFVGELLNVWMQSDSNEIIDEIFYEVRHTAGSTVYNKNFFKHIKAFYPETIFHGFDVGHFYWSLGEKYLDYLLSKGLQQSELYYLTVENMEQGRLHSSIYNDCHTFRVGMMTENFIRIFDSLEDESVMSAKLGAAHAKISYYPVHIANSETMASKLINKYGNKVQTTRIADGTRINVVGEPFYITATVGESVYITIENQRFAAENFGKENISEWLPTYKYREFIRIFDAYDYFKDHPLTGDILPYNNFPMEIHLNEIFKIRYIKADGAETITFFRTSGEIWNGKFSASEFIVSR